MHTRQQDGDYEASYPERANPQSYLIALIVQDVYFHTRISGMKFAFMMVFYSNTAKSLYPNYSKQAFYYNYMLYKEFENICIRSRTVVFCVGMNRDIEDMFTKCTTCQKYKTGNHLGALF